MGIVILELSTIALLLWLFWEDLKHRAVYWWLFALLVVCLSLNALQWASPQEWLIQSGCNLGFLVLQLILLTSYFSFKSGRLILLTSGWLGTGDIIFMACTSTAMGVLNFVLFHILSLIIVLAAALLFPSLRTRGVPLAGLQGLLLACLFGILLCTNWNLYDQTWLLFLFS